MLIKPNTINEIRQAIGSGKSEEVFGVDKAARKEDSARKMRPSIAFRLIRSIEPLTDKNGWIIVDDAWLQIDICIDTKKVPANIKDAEKYMMHNPASFYRTGGLIVYTRDDGKSKLGKEMFHVEEYYVGKEHIRNEYIFKVPYGFEDIGGNQALVLFFDFFMDGTPYFQRIESTFKGMPINEIVINRADELANAGKLRAITIPREGGYYLIDKDTYIPNGPKVASLMNSRARGFQLLRQDYIGFITIEPDSIRTCTGVYMFPSIELPMLVITENNEKVDFRQLKDSRIIKK